MMVRPTFSALASAMRPAVSSAPTLTLRTRGSVAVPPLPGATRTSETLGDWAHFHANACSRPPEPTIRIFTMLVSTIRAARHRRSSMPEVAHAGEDHAHAVFVGGGDDFFVAFAAARLNDGLDAVLGSDIDAVAEREEGIGGHGTAFDGEALVLGLECGDARGIDARHLPGANSNGHSLAGEHNGV